MDKRQMDYRQLEVILSSGTNLTINSSEFGASQLRCMAKAAVHGNSLLTIVAGSELSVRDMELISSDAPGHVAFDLTQLPNF